MPESKKRKDRDFTPPPLKGSGIVAANPRWLVPAMITCFVVGLLWIALFYIAQGSIPVMSSLQGWNIVIGFVFLGAGLVMATRWR